MHQVLEPVEAIDSATVNGSRFLRLLRTSDLAREAIETAPSDAEPDPGLGAEVAQPPSIRASKRDEEDLVPLSLEHICAASSRSSFLSL
jgi:hypothetical protein